MYQGKYVYAQITEFLPRRAFDGIVAKYNGNKYSVLYLLEPNALYGLRTTHQS
jgi:hypothetical protein